MSNLGVIVGNDPAKLDRFTTWLGRRPSFALLAFNQMSADAFAKSISYIAKQAFAFHADGATILWSVPCPGARQLEAIVAGGFDMLYSHCASAIVNVYDRRDRSPVYIRLPWEFNLAGQQNNACDRNGHWDAALFVKAWTRLAKIFKSAIPAARLIWCPNIERHEIDPAACWPGSEFVDIVSQDFYLQSRWSKPGAFNSFFMNCDYGLNWGYKFARGHGKQYALSEYGINSDIFTQDAVEMFSWLKSLGRDLNHHAWWDRPENINCEISGGKLPGIGKAYRDAFGK